MDGKPPESVINDGDLAMKNAIRLVFPRAHHRLCAWHLIRNATSNVSNPKFIANFKMCMLGDLEISVFRQKWFMMIDEFGLQDNRWVQDVYAKKEVWATAHIRGKFFGGFRTTSRCEGLHSVFSKYVRSQYDFTDFLIHFQRCLENIRFNEVKDDFESAAGLPVMQTSLEPHERHATYLYTREVFFLFRPFLIIVGALWLVEERETGSYVIYVIGKYGKPNATWQVCFCQEPMEFKCSCLRFESLGIPCEHILIVLARLNLTEIPDCLVLKRWTKDAKENTGDCNDDMFGSVSMARFSSLIDCYHQLAALACTKPERFNEKREECLREIAKYKAEDEDELNGTQNGSASQTTTVKNLRHCRTKGRSGSGKTTQRCGRCRLEGHNVKTCPVDMDIRNHAIFREDCSSFGEQTQVMDDEMAEDEWYWNQTHRKSFENTCDTQNMRPFRTTRRHHTGKSSQHCSRCRLEGHNVKTCPVDVDIQNHGKFSGKAL